MLTSQNQVFREALILKESLIQLRRELHQYPELSFQEYKTSSVVKRELERIPGMKVYAGLEHTGLSTGVVGELAFGDDGPVIALRADMDALPIEEENEEDYRSKQPGVMHACGHDAHTTIVLGAARILAEKVKPAFAGTIKFIFQPAEEDTDEQGVTGSPYMISHGVLDNVDVALALHMDPEYPVGHVRLHEGPSMANVDTFTGSIHGTGGHGAYPHLGTDPTWMLSFILQSIHGISARKVSPLEPAVISVCHIEGGSSTNVIPSKVLLEGTMRSYTKETRKELEEELHQAFAVAQSLGGSYELEVKKGEPALNNSSKAINLVRETIGEFFPEMVIHDKPYGLGGEDFGYMAEKVPAAMFFLGAGKDDRKDRGLHMPCFDINEEALPVGASILAGSVLKFMSDPQL
ncbi:M20 metallopeptidase family protein [Bacillus sp. FJAT-44742]|uniref:M20 metallopeptidase family protein n=1 Tax=Bacillus sp. FJAT-44742 TaxID=2014005 RepID=UPI000C234829|nr:M20 family metallopeptidase [Bacillus sp. FJAT-44742]